MNFKTPLFEKKVQNMPTMYLKTLVILKIKKQEINVILKTKKNKDRRELMEIQGLWRFLVQTRKQDVKGEFGN